MADDSIVVGVEWEGEPCDHPLPLEEVRCKNVQKAGLRETISEKETPSRDKNHAPGERTTSTSFPHKGSLPYRSHRCILNQSIFQCSPGGDFISRRLRCNAPATDRIGEVPYELNGVLV